MDITVPETYLVLNSFLICDYVKGKEALAFALVFSLLLASSEQQCTKQTTE